MRYREGDGMGTQMEIGGITVDVVRKKVKNMHLRVCRRTGRIGISAPMRMPLSVIRLFVLSKQGWIKKQQARLEARERMPVYAYRDQEVHQVWGEAHALCLVDSEEAPSVRVEELRMILSVRADTPFEQKKMIVEAWYRELVEAALPILIRKWEPVLGVKVRGCTVRTMKTRWGSCTPRTGRIRINTELAKRPPECLEYIVVHELVHLMEPSHNQRFVGLMTQVYPQWKLCHAALNRHSRSPHPGIG